MTSGSTLTPVRRQYLKVKSAYPDALLLFRMGDFYETFDDDAELAARELEIALTSRTMGKGLKVPMAGVPAHALESYLARLIKKGHKVAICEQLTDPATSKGLVERDVVRVVTPGTVLESSLLDQDANNYLAALVEDGEQVALAYVDITTGEFSATQLSRDRALAELERIAPAEILIPAGEDLPHWIPLEERLKFAGDANQRENPAFPLTQLNPASFDLDLARDALLAHYDIRTLESFGCDHLPLVTGPPAPSLTTFPRLTRPSSPGWRPWRSMPRRTSWRWTPKPGATWSCFRPVAGKTASCRCWRPWT